MPKNKRHHPSKLTLAEEAEVVRLYKENFTQQQLTKIFPCCHSTIGNILSRHNVISRSIGRRKRPPLSLAQKSELVRLYTDGWSQHKLAEHFSCGILTIRVQLQQKGVSLRRGKFVYVPTPQEIKIATTRLRPAREDYESDPTQLHNETCDRCGGLLSYCSCDDPEIAELTSTRDERNKR